MGRKNRSSTEALESSIQKWEKIQSLVGENKFSSASQIIMNRCPLCNGCRGCVIHKLTGEEQCNATPFYSIRAILIGWDRRMREREQDQSKPIEELVSEMVSLLKSCRNIIAKETVVAPIEREYR
jgi:hypothetical protein